MTRQSACLLLLLGPLAMAGCAGSGIPSGIPRVGPGNHSAATELIAPQPVVRTSVNAGKRSLGSIATRKVPSLDELVSAKPQTKPQAEEEVKAEDRLRLPAIRETALAFGARGGLAYTSWQINKMLEDRAAKMDQTYDFRMLVVRGPDGVVVLPPVISEAKDSYELSEEGRAIRVADEIYEIIAPASFAPTTPLWHTYLIRDYGPPKMPPDEILPRTPFERGYWERYVREGWEAGVKQANDIFQADLNRLERDYQGMIRYKRLLTEGMVSAPIVAKAPLGVTGGGSDMRVNDRSIRIMRNAELQTDTSLWEPTISQGDPGVYAVPKGDNTVKDYPNNADRFY